MTLPTFLALVGIPYVVSCSSARAPTRWTEASALAGHHTRFDLDRDGRFAAAEYDRTLWNGPPFPSADTNGDGDLSAAELATLVRAQSPTSFDGRAAPEGLKRAGANIRLPSAEERDVWELLVWMGDALRSRGRPGPDPDAVALAVRSGNVQSADARVVLDTIRPEWTAQGWAWPRGLP